MSGGRGTGGTDVAVMTDKQGVLSSKADDPADLATVVPAEVVWRLTCDLSRCLVAAGWLVGAVGLIGVERPVASGVVAVSGHRRCG